MSESYDSETTVLHERLLSQQYPPPFTSTRHPQNNSGVNAAIVLARTFLIINREPDMADIDNGLIQYACMDVDEEKDGYKEHVAALQRQLDEYLNSIPDDKSYYNLVECNERFRLDIWEREEFLLSTGFVIKGIKDDVQHFTFSEGPARLRAEADGTSVAMQLAKDSLVHWDGSGNLTDLITSKYLRDPSDNNTFISCSPPLCVRVKYTPSDNNCPGFLDIMKSPLHIRIECGQLVQDRDDNILRREGPYDPQSYRLQVVVRLRSENEGSEDYVRVYQPNGDTYSASEATNKNVPARVNEAWRLGEHGYSYMLYFTHSSMPMIGNDELREVPTDVNYTVFVPHKRRIRDRYAPREELVSGSSAMESIIIDSEDVASLATQSSGNDENAQIEHQAININDSHGQAIGESTLDRQL